MFLSKQTRGVHGVKSQQGNEGVKEIEKAFHTHPGIKARKILPRTPTTRVYNVRSLLSNLPPALFDFLKALVVHSFSRGHLRFQDGNLLLEVVELAQLLGFVDLHPESLVQPLLDLRALPHLLPELLEGFQGLR